MGKEAKRGGGGVALLSNINTDGNHLCFNKREDWSTFCTEQPLSLLRSVGCD